MSSEKLSESTTCMRLIDPKLKDSGWELNNIIREYKITNGKIVPQGRTGKRNDPLIADYVLQLGENFKVAVVEAKWYDIQRHIRSKLLATYFPKTFLAIHSKEKIDIILDFFEIPKTKLRRKLHNIFVLLIH